MESTKQNSLYYFVLATSIINISALQGLDRMGIYIPFIFSSQRLVFV